MIISCNDILANKELLEAYAKEVDNEFKPEIIPDVELYNAMENNGVFHCFGEYCDGKLIGFITMLTYTIPHYSKLCTTIESIYVDKEHRKYGTAKRLIDEAEAKAKELGAYNMFLTAPVGSRLLNVASYWGYKDTNVVFTKKL